MQLSDLLITFQWWGYLFVIGLIFFPLVRNIFSEFLDKGYPFAKVIGTIVISYLVFVLGVAHIAPFTQTTIYIITFFLAICVTLFLLRFRQKVVFSLQNFFLIILEEILFLAGLLFWSFIRAHQPDIFGLEKYMDFGFVNSILRSTYFPPRDMWYTPLPINYYYFGHLVTAVLTKLSGIPSLISFNLMIATLFAFTYTLSFSIVGNLWHTFLVTKNKLKNYFLSFSLAGLIGGFLVSMGGNLHTIYTFFTAYPNDSPVPFWQLTFSPSTFPNSYWYPNATRFIYHTIHEFPIYSFVVSDLHGHVLDIPLVLTTIALLFAIISKPQLTNSKQNTKNKKQFLNLFRSWFSEFGIWIFLGFLIACMYMTNAWDGMIYILVSLPIIVYKNYQYNKNFLQNVLSFSFIQKLLIIIFCFIVFSLPFSLFFNPGALVGGIGLICAPQFLINIGKIGPFVFEPNHCMHSPLWQMLILYGFFLFWLISFILIIFKQKDKLSSADFFVAILSTMSLLLIIIPEFFYLRDIYTTYFRANTMFKLVYQAFIIFSLSISFMIFRFFHYLKTAQLPLWKKIFVMPYVFIGVVFFILVSIYPYFAVNSYYQNLSVYKGLNGFSYLVKLYPSDALAINWINVHITGQPVILEAQGDSYTEYARVSSNTGLPTVLGWPVHEWLWRGTYDIVPPRSTDIKTMYETPSITVFKSLAKKYNVKYVFVGQLEKTKYPLLQENKFKKIGKMVFHEGVTTIYQVAF